MSNLWMDLKFALRNLIRRPGFSLLLILTVAIGIGATTAIFSVVHGVLMRPLPYADPDQLVMVWENHTKTGTPRNNLAPGNIVDIRQQVSSLQSVGVVYPYASATLTGDGEPEQLTVAAISKEVIPLLGLAPLHGRSLVDEDMVLGAAPVALMSERLWRSRFGADPGIIDQNILLDGLSATVIGVLPDDFYFPNRETDLWMPFALPAEHWPLRQVHILQAVARLADGTTLAQARAEIGALGDRLADDFPETNDGVRLELIPLLEQEVGDVRRSLIILLAAVGFILLIACANVANMLLARASGRGQEMAVRGSLGAGRGRVIRQLLTESLLMALIGGGLGIALAGAGVRLLHRLAPAGLPRLDQIALNGGILAAGLGVTLLTGLVFGLAPAIFTSRFDLSSAMKESQRSGQRRSGRVLQRVLAVAQVALAVVLLTGALLLLRSLASLQAVEPGFRVDDMQTLRILLPEAKYPQPDSRVRFFEELLQGLRSVPGVEEVGAINFLPMSGDMVSTSLTQEGRQPPAEGESLAELQFRVVSDDYFKTLGIPLLEGRSFESQDHGLSLPVTVINQAAARTYWPDGESPIGKRIKLGPRPDDLPWVTVVGVVGNVRVESLDKPPLPTAYRVLRQRPAIVMTVALRGSGDPEALIQAAKGQVFALDPTQPVDRVRSIEEVLAGTLSKQRFAMILLTVFAGAALVLAASGIYGLMSFSVSQRRHEIGVRMALGLAPDETRRWVLGQGMVLIGLGLAIGLVLALATGRTMTSLLFGVSAADPVTLGLVLAALSLIGLLACYLPARRATRIDPVTALRME